MKSRTNHQLSLGPLPLAKTTHDAPVRPKHTQDADLLATELFDAALTAARVSTPEVAHLLNVSESLVRRMRSTDARERVSFAQMLRLPPAFHIELHRALNKRFGFGRAALAQLMDAASDLALVVE